MISAFNLAIALVMAAIESFNNFNYLLYNLILTASAFYSYNKLSSIDDNKAPNKAYTLPTMPPALKAFPLVI